MKTIHIPNLHICRFAHSPIRLRVTARLLAVQNQLGSSALDWTLNPALDALSEESSIEP
jgi:hypothetical protein